MRAHGAICARCVGAVPGSPACPDCGRVVCGTCWPHAHPVDITLHASLSTLEAAFANSLKAPIRLARAVAKRSPASRALVWRTFGKVFAALVRAEAGELACALAWSGAEEEAVKDEQRGSDSDGRGREAGSAGAAGEGGGAVG